MKEGDQIQVKFMFKRELREYTHKKNIVAIKEKEKKKRLENKEEEQIFIASKINVIIINIDERKKRRERKEEKVYMETDPMSLTLLTPHFNNLFSEENISFLLAFEDKH